MDIPPTVIWGVVIGSVIMLGASLLIMPAVIIRIPADYFNHKKRPRSKWSSSHPAIRILVKVGQNVLGALLALAGIAMLALPGQGLLTVLVGFMLMDIPGKYRIEKWLLRRGLKRPVNWLRRKHGREALVIDDGKRSGGADR